MSDIPRYAPNPHKAVEVILWIASQRPGIDVYHVVKCAFFADKEHIGEYGRPIIGDSYEAAWFGPLPEVVYGLLRRRPIEVLALDTNGYLPFTVDDSHAVYSERGPNLRLLSESDVEALSNGLEHVDGRSFDDIYIETHDDPAYKNAQGFIMDYRHFISDDDPDRNDKIEFIEETADTTVI